MSWPKLEGGQVTKEKYYSSWNTSEGVRNVKDPDELRVLKNANQPRAVFAVSKIRRGMPLLPDSRKGTQLHYI